MSGLSGTARHFTVLREDVGDTTAVPTGNRSLRSANFPGRYVRHRDFLAYLDPLSASSPQADRQDATFAVVSGLAHAGCYSFRAINESGYYLRHYNMRLTLQRDDGSAIFKGDATFCGRAGLAGGGTLSFESYNLPGRYLRHYNYELRLDLRTSDSVFASDASYTVTSPLA
jgi:hypothetical protein